MIPTLFLVVSRKKQFVSDHSAYLYFSQLIVNIKINCILKRSLKLLAFY
ncbi:conserved hypothetical protein [Carnobacterium maltaromaticum]|nr:conserved hypothetical protein [Carnobacterium maltaromaticum]